jgi:hypothetical protein
MLIIIIIVQSNPDVNGWWDIIINVHCSTSPVIEGQLILGSLFDVSFGLPKHD